MENVATAAIIGSVLVFIGTIIGLIVAQIRYRQTQPRINAKSDVDYQVAVFDGFKASGEAVSQALIVNAKLALTALTLTEANVGLMRDRDGMPKLIAEMKAAELIEAENKSALRLALLNAGIPIEKQPVDKIPLPLSILTPPNLLNLLKQQHDAKTLNPNDIEALQAEIIRLRDAAKVNEDTNATSAAARLLTATNVKEAHDSQLVSSDPAA